MWLLELELELEILPLLEVLEMLSWRCWHVTCAQDGEVCQVFLFGDKFYIYWLLLIG